jgi:hypothetical protein
MVKRIISWWSKEKPSKLPGPDAVMKIDSLLELERIERHTKGILVKIKEVRDKQLESLRLSERLAKRYWGTLYNINLRRKQIERDNQRRNRS